MKIWWGQASGASVVLVLIFQCFLPSPVNSVLCHSCFKGCANTKNTSNCDCTSEEANSCQGPFCFAKLEIFADEKAVSVQKGCSSEIPGGSEGCYSAGHPDSTFCLCRGQFCNSKTALDSFRPKDFPDVTCCHCPNPEEQSCPYETCTEDTCTGSYCYFDYVTRDQTCGYGHPQLQNFLRTKTYWKFRNETTCARYVAGKRTIVHGCTCASARCNVAKRLHEFDAQAVLNDTGKPETELHYCYSIHKSRRKPMNESIFKLAKTCEGHFCFVSYTTAFVAVESYGDDYYDDENQDDNGEESAVPVLEKTHELLAGCLKSDSSEKVEVGCSSEWQNSPQEPLVKHCICRGHMCNYFYQITGESMKKYKSLRLPRPRVQDDKYGDSPNPGSDDGKKQTAKVNVDKLEGISSKSYDDQIGVVKIAANLNANVLFLYMLIVLAYIEVILVQCCF